MYRISGRQWIVDISTRLNAYFLTYLSVIKCTTLPDCLGIILTVLMVLYCCVAFPSESRVLATGKLNLIGIKDRMSMRFWKSNGGIHIHKYVHILVHLVPC